MSVDTRFTTPRRPGSGNMNAINAFLLSAAEPDSPFLPAAPGSVKSTRRMSVDGSLGVKGEGQGDMHTPPMLGGRRIEDLSSGYALRGRGPTPPSHGSTYSHSSINSHISSMSKSSLTDASTSASLSSTRTPPSGEIGSESGHGVARRTYGEYMGRSGSTAGSAGESGRRFGRVVSAPVGSTMAHMREMEGKMLYREVEKREGLTEGSETAGGRQDDLVDKSLSVTITAPNRPALQHTSSTSSVLSHPTPSHTTTSATDAYKTPIHTSRFQSSRSTDRTKLLTRSTGIKGLGGPRRPMQFEESPAVEREEIEVEGKGLGDAGGERFEDAEARSTTPQEEPPQVDVHGRYSPPRTKTPSLPVPIPATDHNPVSAYHRMSPPKSLLSHIPATIPEDAETDERERRSESPRYLSAQERRPLSRSSSVSPETRSTARMEGNLARHRHSPSVPTAMAEVYPKENRGPERWSSEKQHISALGEMGPPGRYSPAPELHSTAREHIRRLSGTPEMQNRRSMGDASDGSGSHSRSTTLRAEPVASTSRLPDATPAREYRSPPMPEGLPYQHQQGQYADPPIVERDYGSHHSGPAQYAMVTPQQSRIPTSAGGMSHGAFESARAAPPVPLPPQPPEAYAPTPSQSTLPPGRKGIMFNGKEYERIGILGRGGSSKVYSVLDPAKRVIYALKRVQLDRSDPETITNYLNEIDLLKRLSGHDRIIQLIDHSISHTPSGRPKILQMMMELGETDFASLLDAQRGKPLNMNFVALYWQQMLEAVHAVHDQNVVHTDLKPANFVLVKGKLKIIDFGIAKAIANDTVNIQRDTQIGTVNYMSPEAILKMSNMKVHKLSFSSDVWSLGCILYQMIYGGPPFQGITGGPLVKMQVIGAGTFEIPYPASVTATRKPNQEPISPGESAVTIPLDAIDTIQNCLTHNRDHRMTIPGLLDHPFLKPRSAGQKPTPTKLPPGWSCINQTHMAQLLKFATSPAGKAQIEAQGMEEVARTLFADLRRNVNHASVGLSIS